MDVDIEIDEFVKSTRNLYEAEDNERIEDPALGTTNFSLTKGMTWRTILECRKFMKDMTIAQKFSFKQKKNDKTRYKLVCKDPNASGDKNNKNVQAKALWVANELEDFARPHPTFAPVDLHNKIYNEYGVLISYWTAWRTRVLLLERINEHDEKNGKIWLEKQPKRTWARAYFDLTSKCDVVTSNFSESFNAWILKIRDKPLFQFVDKYTLTVVALMHDRRELGLELTDGNLVPAVTDVIKRYCSHYYTVESFRATYAGYIYPVANQDDWDKIKPTNVVLPPPNNRNPGRPRKQRIRGRDEEKSSGKRKCRRCGQVGHNTRTCKQEGGETSSAPPNNIGRGVGGSSTHAGKESDDSIVDLTGEVSDNSTEAQTGEGSNSLTQAQTREIVQALMCAESFKALQISLKNKRKDNKKKNKNI
ncbi:hypothetical protein IFM89_001546 [Coptis chinensis]|uniref:CCHC-type domain-containing protein n=1 Tax=Coptis chinensis TaxID=261450 RepID=A0A835LI44_9MAGN|nr:hypothetical protein IFM89_001546 [Coptis chinensis]